MAGGGITILASAPVFATAGTTAVVTGGVLNSIAVMYVDYKCGMHWSDEEEGKKEFTLISGQIPGLMEACKPSTQPQILRPAWMNDYSSYNQPQENPPSYEASQVIYNQRATGIYPDLSGLTPTAPSYESLSKENY